MSKQSLFKRPELLECNLCFERYSGLCPEHFLADKPMMQDYIDQLVKKRLDEYKKEVLKKNTNPFKRAFRLEV